MADKLVYELQDIKEDRNTNLKPENLKKGVTCLGVVGTYEGGGGSTDIPVKLFATKDEMNQSTGNKEGDLAIVYSSTISNWQVDTQSNIMIFPDTVVLPNVFTDYAYLEFRNESVKSLDIFGNIGDNRASIDIYGDDLEVRVNYTSDDGMTYTKTEGEERIELPVEVKYERAEEWNDVIGYFIQTGSASFDGLYNYKNDTWTLAGIQLNATDEYVYDKIYYGKNGISNGTLGTNVSLYGDDVNAEIYKKIKDAYNNIEPTVIEDGWRAPETINCIPTKDDGTPLLDTSSVTSMRYMFSECTNLEMIPLLNTSLVTDTSNTFSYCKNLKTISLIDTSLVTNMTNMFSRCSSLQEIPLIDTSSVISTSYMFSGCSNLQTIPLLNTKLVTNMSAMFDGCGNLQEIPLIDTSSVIYMHYMFENCSSLETIPLLNTQSVTTMEDMFNGCLKLTDNSLNNILQMCINSSISNSKTLRRSGISQEQAERCQSLDNWAAFVAAGWTTGY